jgi:hypothetical protein
MIFVEGDSRPSPDLVVDRQLVLAGCDSLHPVHHATALLKVLRLGLVARQFQVAVLKQGIARII